MNVAEQCAEISRQLLRWYRRSARDLPWRRRSDPYAIWISEVMLQQTRVTAAVPYFQRFLKTFPNVRRLAAAKIDDVLKAWEGLGYYGRARNLHAAARRIVREFGGKIPSRIETLRTLPGIGTYTAAAIASIAFGCDEPVLDGNVIRVLCRLFAIGQDPRRSATQKRLTSRARKLISSGKAGTFNQAMMDLGATICIPRTPRCELCPLQKLCRARARNLQTKLPRRAPAKELPHYDIAVGVIFRRGRILIDRRNEDGLLGGLWEFPGGKVQRGESFIEALIREVREEVNVEIRVENELTKVQHAYSHFRITMHVFVCRGLRGRAQAIGCSAVKWISPEELDNYAFPAANRRIIAMLRKKLHTH